MFVLLYKQYHLKNCSAKVGVGYYDITQPTVSFSCQYLYLTL